VTARSAPEEIVLVAVELLFPEFESAVDEVTTAVLLIVPLAFDGTEYVLVIVALLPAASVPIEQGYAVVQAPLFETKVSPAGVLSLT